MSNIITHKVGEREYCIVQVPKVPKQLGYSIVGNLVQWEIPHLIWSGNPPEPDHDEWEEQEIELPSGDYDFLFIAEQASEEQAEQVVELVSDAPKECYIFRNYEDDRNYKEFGYGYPHNSLMSLIRANFPNHDQFNHIVLLKNEQI